MRSRLATLNVIDGRRRPGCDSVNEASDQPGEVGWAEHPFMAAGPEDDVK